VAHSRRRCIAARRLLTRKRRRGGQCDSLVNLFKKARTALCKSIKRAKSEAWGALIGTLDDDPCGLPYRIVMDRLRRSGSALSESLEPRIIDRLLDELPPDEVHNPDEIWANRNVYDPTYLVSPDKVVSAIRGRRKGGCPAPGPDGLSLDLWKRVPRCVIVALATLYTRCLEEGKVPRAWKRAILVLIPKGTIDINFPKARPICLLDDIGNFFERIVNRRLKDHLNTLPRWRVPLDRFSGMQYGFREGVSTIDALDAVTGRIRDIIDEGKVVLAVSLDIKNAFNSLSWGAIRWALERGRFPDYLRRVIDYYLSDRWVEFFICTGERRARGVVRGVPQGSVLGPLLWNIAYDYVLRSECRERPGCSVTGYADDTLILCSASSVEAAQSNINRYIDLVLRRIEFLSLEMAASKTEAVLFRSNRRRWNYTDPLIRIKNTFIHVSPSMKYLGVILDSKLTFKPHFQYLDVKIGKVTRALGSLMPNLRGPQEKKRRLYAGIIELVVMYAAPIWANSLTADARRLFRRWQRAIAVRVCCAYRSVSFDSATLLARLIPFELLAERARIFWRVQDAKEIGPLTPEMLTDIRRSERIITQRQWVILASRPGAAGVKLRDALVPLLPS